MARRILIVVGAVLALACGAAALYASGQPAESRCTETRPLQPGEAGYAPGGSEAAKAQNEFGAVCVAYTDAPLGILRSGTERWWWFGAVAVVVLTLLLHPVSTWIGRDEWWWRP